jgi:hypothetical protein
MDTQSIPVRYELNYNICGLYQLQVPSVGSRDLSLQDKHILEGCKINYRFYENLRYYKTTIYLSLALDLNNSIVRNYFLSPKLMLNELWLYDI